MNGFHVTPGLLRQIEAASTATESILRAQKALDCSPALDGIRRAQAVLDTSQVSETIRRAQKALDFSPALDGIRRAQAVLDTSQVSETIRRAQRALDFSPALDGIRRAQAVLDTSQVSETIRRAQRALDFSPALDGIRRAQAVLDTSQVSETIRRAQKALDFSPALDGVRRMQAALDTSQVSETIRRAQKALDFSPALDGVRSLSGGRHTVDRLVTHVAEIEVTRKRAQGRDLLGRRLRKVGQAATNRLVRLGSRRKVRRPVGSSLRGVAEFVFSKKSCEQVYDPLITDLRFEYCEALAEKRGGKARWVRARGYGSFLAAVLAHVAASGGHLVVRVWRIFHGGG